MSNLSIAIITLNADKTLQRCLNSLPRHEEIVIVDSGSSDGTERIANEFGARFTTRNFDNFAAQKNTALGLTQHDWVLCIDADEELDSDLRKSIEDVVTNKGRICDVAFRVRRSLVFMDQRMRFGKTTDYPLRLFRRGSGEFCEDIHERFVVRSGTIETLLGNMWHHSYEDLSDYFVRFNNYTSRIAANHYAKGTYPPPLFVHFLRPWFEFFSRFILRLGFLDGSAGYTYALTSSLYTYVKYEKLRELYKRNARP